MPNSPPAHNARPKHEEHRGTAHQRGYDYAWQQVRDYRRALSPFCVRCEALDIVTPVEIVDHKIPVSVRPDLRLTIENTQSLCRKHHAEKTEEDLKRWGAGAQNRRQPAS